ncbi:hypothetical protein ACIBSV_44060 [Embleya sp. NPDC050154]|uniref:hypothetical protein n=1 Tax=Embleya sp. NPDC050154 TaxID=3363988 RepID=UPI003789B9AD
MSNTSQDTSEPTPWARAWARALTATTTYPEHLEPGGTIQTLRFIAGRVTARVDHAGRRHRTAIHVRTLTTEQWQTVAAALTTQPELVRAVRSGSLPAEMTDPTRTGLPIPPPAQALSFSCTCGDATPCAHTTALAHAVTQRLRAHPALVLTLRGAGMRRLAEFLPTPSGSHLEPPDPARDDHVETRADDAYDRWRARLAHTTHPPPEAPPTAGPSWVPEDLPDPDRQALELLIADASRRAALLLMDANMGPCGAAWEADAVVDAVRMLCDPAGLPRLPEVATRTGISENELHRLILAHRLGGPAAVHTAVYRTHPAPTTLAAAVKMLENGRTGVRGPLATQANRITDTEGGVQIRCGPDERWYPYTTVQGEWIAAGGHDADPRAAFRAARAARLERSRTRALGPGTDETCRPVPPSQRTTWRQVRPAPTG